jgi:hypothetical protein
MMMNQSDEAIFFFRKLIFLLYLEIGSLQPKIHKELAARADIKNGFFHGEKQPMAAEIYHRIETETEPQKIIAPFKERTGLSLEDICRAFAEGDWRNKFGGYNAGGPKWSKIADITLALQHQIEQQNWDEAGLLVFQMKRLKTNQGLLINQFDWTERRHL